MLKLTNLENKFYVKLRKSLNTITIILFIFGCQDAFSKSYKIKDSINGSGLKIPRMVSLKNSLTYMRTGPGKEFPVAFELHQKGYPLKIVAEFNNWRKVNTYDNISGWIHTQLLSSLKTGLIIKGTVLKAIPSYSGKTKAKLLPKLLVKIDKCKRNWCKIRITKDKVYVGWIIEDSIWGSTKN